MKIRISAICGACLQEANLPKEAYEKMLAENGRYKEIEFNDENFYIMECPKGHKTYTQLRNQKFELLFEMGAMALLDGYTIECVSSIASSLERFIEFYIKVIAIKKNAPEENIIKSWNLLSKQSERQMGAFYMLQLTEYGETKFIIEQQWIEFRNKVIHKGYIPSSSKAIEYGEYILRFIQTILAFLKNTELESLRKFESIELKKAVERTKDRYMLNIISIPTRIDFDINSEIKDYTNKSFKASLDFIAKDVLNKHFYVKGL